MALLPKEEQWVAETDAQQVFHRLSGCWTYWGWKHDYFKSEADAKAYYQDMLWMLATQMAAPTISLKTASPITASN
jgi:ribonucleoside-diphosphate reductase alpha chain